MRCAAARDFSLPALFSSPARPRISHQSPPAHPRCSLVEREKRTALQSTFTSILPTSLNVFRGCCLTSHHCVSANPRPKSAFLQRQAKDVQALHMKDNAYEGYSSTYTAHLSRLRLCTFSVRSNNPKKAISAVSVISRSNDQW